MQKQKKKFFEGHRSTFCIKVPFGIGHPPPTHQMQSTCVWESSRVPNLQTEFNYLDFLKSYCIFSDFVVPMVPTWSPWSPSSPHHPCHPHIIPIAPRRFPSGPHGCGLCGLHPMLSPWSPWSPRHLRGLHVIPIVPTSSPHCLEGAHIIPNPQLPTPPTPHQSGGGGPKSVKMQ